MTGFFRFQKSQSILHALLFNVNLVNRRFYSLKDILNKVPAKFDHIYVEREILSSYQSSSIFSQMDISKLESRASSPYVLCLPPPNLTGSLHIGHALTVALEDSLVRWHRMRGRKVLWVPGFDHAGIATQSTFERDLQRRGQPDRHSLGRNKFLELTREWASANRDRIWEQIVRLGASVNWDYSCYTLDEKFVRAVNTAFIRLHDAGLITRALCLVNWCPTLRSTISDIEVNWINIEKPTQLQVPGVERSVDFGKLYCVAYRIARPSTGGPEWRPELSPRASTSPESPGSQTSGGEADSDAVLVWTTRPETLPADVAVAVHPDDARYAPLLASRARLLHPLHPTYTVPLVSDRSVDPDFGSGAVKITPGHDLNDWEVGKRLELPVVDIFTDAGRIARDASISSREALDAEPFRAMLSGLVGAHRFEARSQVIERLRASGALRGERAHAHKLPLCSRTGDVVEWRAREQWFLDCATLAADAVRAPLEFEPPSRANEWREWLTRQRSHSWCLSRQLWWGHQIPAYKATHTDGRSTSGVPSTWVTAFSIEEARLKAAQKLGVDQSKLSLEQDPDVLDTWFSSGLFPFASLGWPDTESEAYKRFYPTTEIETGGDILFFWVSRMVMLGLQLTGQLPFRRVLLHGLVVDAAGKKMSKSLGNIIDPLQLIDGAYAPTPHASASAKKASAQKRTAIDTLELVESQLSTTTPGLSKSKKSPAPQSKPTPKTGFGLDALRLTLCSYDFKEQLVRMNMEHVDANRRFCNKLWNATRFVLFVNAQLDEKRPQTLPSSDRLTRLALARNYQELREALREKTAQLTTSAIVGTDEWLLLELHRVVESVNQHFEHFDLNKAVAATKYFLHQQLCDVYLESVKKSARGVSETDASSWVGAKERALLLSAALSSGLHLLHPVAPLVTEYLYSTLRAARLPCTCSAGMPELTTEHNDLLAQFLCMQQFPQPHN